MDTRYRELTGTKFNDILYNSMYNDIDRIIISRWRLSSHMLYVETGRYKRPKIDRLERICCLCNTLEDEYHALFICIAHFAIRIEFHDLLTRRNTVQLLFNPSNIEEIKETAEYIRQIERNMKILKMLQ